MEGKRGNESLVCASRSMESIGGHWHQQIQSAHFVSRCGATRVEHRCLPSHIGLCSRCVIALMKESVNGGFLNGLNKYYVFFLTSLLLFFFSGLIEEQCYVNRLLQPVPQIHLRFLFVVFDM